MELRQLEHFLAVAKHGRFTAAAREVLIVQSALSTSIRNLERELGAPLFDRATRRVVLTPAGREVIPLARRMVADAEAVRDVVAAVAGLRTGRVSVGAIQSLAHVDLPAELARFRRTHPGVHVEVRDTVVDELVEALRLGQLDLAYLVLGGAVPGGLTVHHVFADELVVIAGPGHPFVRRDQVSLAEASREPLVGFGPGTALAQRIRQLFMDHGLRARFVAQTNQLDLQAGLVRNGHGVAIVTRSRADRSGLPAATLVQPKVEWRVALATRTPRPANPVADALLRHLIDAPHEPS
ncbi:LysR family transcriptional regulator [Nonomuraea sp. B12E4]|uniref:LysR family transcriptional regulator n=1 Tax=Nonomuraea sp. B12E4 TaxID=3153564 RepID=UPI00325E3517